MVVALRKESVDRNQDAEPAGQAQILVALRKESVDRNYIIKITVCRPAVALRKESVDRNITASGDPANCGKSLSARRAWIEIA